MRNVVEIEQAHDRLAAIALGEVPNPLAGRDELVAALDALCWVLDHKHNEHFQEMLSHIDSYLAARGYSLGKRTMH